MLFGKYELLERINIGGMAEIVKARDTRSSGEPIVAVKRILPHLMEDQQFKTMFLDESRVLAQLDHEEIIRAFEIGEVDGMPYIALEYVYGQDARMLFHRSRRSEENIPLPLACYIMAQVCAGLHYAHEQTDAHGDLLGLVHRDVSLQNILISYDGDVKIIDFGIAKSDENMARTEAGIVKGKFGYMSPEQIRGERLDRRSDVFACGICLYELLTSERLFSGESDYAAIEKVRNVDIRPPSNLNRQIPSSLEKIVLKALAKDARDRYRTSNDLRRALLAFMTDSHNECGPRDLTQHMRKAFSDEIRKQPSPEAVVAGMGSGAGDEGTGLAAFDNLDQVSTVSALNPEPEPAPVPQPEPAPAPRARPRGDHPMVPPIVPRPQSIPGMPASHFTGQATPDPGQVPAVAMGYPQEDPEVDDDEVTRLMHISETYTGQPAPSSGPSLPQASSGPLPANASPPAGAPSGGAFPVRPDYPPVDQPGSAAVPSPQVSAASTPAAGSLSASLRGVRPANLLPWVGIVLGILGVIVGALYLTKPPSAGSIHLSTNPQDAKVTVDGKAVAASSSPFVLDGLTADEDHEIEVSKAGYRGWSTRLSVRSGQTLELPTVTLEPQAAAATPQAPAPAAVAGEQGGATPTAGTEPATAAKKTTSSTTRRMKTGSSQAKKKRKKKTASKAVAAGSGTLRINSRPWSKVYVDGRFKGNTPQMNLKLPAGRHKVKLVNPDFGLSKTLTVTVKANQVVTKVMTLQ